MVLCIRVVQIPHKFLTNKVRLCERSEPQSNRLLDKLGLWRIEAS